jgi:hypothetical protein
MDLQTLHVSMNIEKHLKTPERQGRRNLLHRSRNPSTHTPLGVCDMHWIKVGRVETHWIYTHCMCHERRKTPQNPRNGRVEGICCTGAGSLTPTHQ